MKKPNEYLSFLVPGRAAIRPVLTSINIPMKDALRYPGKWYALPASVVDALADLVEAAEPLRGEQGNITEAFDALDDAQEE